MVAGGMVALLRPLKVTTIDSGVGPSPNFLPGPQPVVHKLPAGTGSTIKGGGTGIPMVNLLPATRKLKA